MRETGSMYRSKVYKNADLGVMLNIADKLGVQYKAMDQWAQLSKLTGDDLVDISIFLLDPKTRIRRVVVLVNKIIMNAPYIEGECDVCKE